MIAGREPGTLASLPAGTTLFYVAPAGLLMLADGLVCGWGKPEIDWKNWIC